MTRRFTRLAGFVALVFLVLVAVPRFAGADAGAEAAVLQAEGLVRELDGDLPGALELLRKAYATSSDDPTIAFDLARVSIELLDDPPASDLLPFLALTPTSDTERTLRAYILATGGDLLAAVETLQPVVSAAPADAPPAAPVQAPTAAPPFAASPDTETSGDVSADTGTETLAAVDVGAPEVETDTEALAHAGGDTEAGEFELADLRDELELYLEAQQAQTPDRLNLRLMVGVQGDSNVNLDNSLPASERAGLRFVANGSLRTAPFESLPGLQGGLTFDLGLHVVNRELLGAYDTATGMSQISYETEVGPLALYSEAYGLYVGAETFRAPFMYEVGGLAEVRWPLTITPGIYVDASWRDYLDGNTDYNPGLVCGDQPRIGEPRFEERLSAWIACQQTRAEGRDDRDGPRVTAGLLAEWLGEDLALSLRVGFQMENAQGPHQVQRGIDSALLFTWNLWRLELLAGLTVEWRRYPNWPGKRSDVRIMPQLDVGLSITDWLAVRASYFLIHNVSDAEPRIIDTLNGTRFEYTRHIATLSVEGRY